jgi:hypothetical protein
MESSLDGQDWEVWREVRAAVENEGVAPPPGYM